MSADKYAGWDPKTDPVVELRNAHVIHKSRTGKLFRPAASPPPPASWWACRS